MSIYAVNGKTPVAAWIPSLDTAGNGTTTLTDLAGSKNGTLTNMDAATDWVADTGAGGVRALDFDGVNDYALTTFNPFTEIGNDNAWSISLWMYQPIAKNGARIFGNSINTSSTRWYLATSTTAVFWGFGNTFNIATELTITFAEWLHICVVYDPEAGQVQNYLNGVNTTNNTYSGDGVFANRNTEIGDVRDVSVPFRGKLDDIRVFDQPLVAADASALYAGGFGRGITFGGTIQTRRRRQLAGYGL